MDQLPRGSLDAVGPCGRRLADSSWHCTQPAEARQGSPRPHTRNRKAAAQSGLSTDSPRGDPGRARVGLWRSLRTWVAGLGLSRMNSEQTAGCRRQKGLPPGDVGGNGAGSQGTKPGVAVGVDGGWSHTRLEWEPLRCPNGPGRAALAQSSPAIGSETRKGTDRAGWAPQDCLLSAQTPALGYLPQARLRPCPPPLSSLAGSLARPCSSGLQILAFLKSGRTSFDIYSDSFPITEGTSEAPCPGSLHFRFGRCGKQLAPGAPASL